MRTHLPSWIAALTLLAACSGDRVGVEPSGFLGNTSQLEPGRADQAQLVYIDHEADFSGYRRVLVEPVVVWEPTAASDAPAAELQALADAFGRELRDELALEFELVERPGPETLRIRTALTRVRASGASVEMEILDAASGERLVAVADARDEAEEPGDAAGDRASARAAFAFWAERARVRLAAFRSFDAAERAHDAAAAP